MGCGLSSPTVRASVAALVPAILGVGPGCGATRPAVRAAPAPLVTGQMVAPPRAMPPPACHASPGFTPPAFPRADAEPDAAGGSIFEKTWSWADENGSPIRFSAWRGRLLVVSLIYTTCTTVCPLSIEKMRHVAASLTGVGRAAEYVLVTLDPMADTSDRLRRFKVDHALPARWHLLRGTPEQTEALAAFLRLKVLNLGDHVLHEARVVVLDGAGVVVGHLRG